MSSYGIGITGKLNKTDSKNPYGKNDEIYISAGHFTSTLGPVSPGIQYSSNSYFQVSQIPSPTNVQVTSSGANSLWGYPNNTKLYPNVYYIIKMNNNKIKSFFLNIKIIYLLKNNKA
jgi:hypothetical protein